jgi:hypothetical protein
MRDLVDLHYPEADLIRVVQDNLSTHTLGTLYETLPSEEAHCILQRLEFYYTGVCGHGAHADGSGARKAVDFLSFCHSRR